MFAVREIVKSFAAHEVLRGVSCELADRSLCGLIGPSGGGKSVLLKILAGVGRFDSGELVCDLAPGESVSLMFQEGALFDSLSIFDNVAFPLVSGRVPASLLPKRLRDEVYDKVSIILARVGLSAAALKMPGQISGGMRKRASLARALVSRPRLLLLDDPTSGLDPVASSVIMDLIVELHREYRPTTVIVSHDLRRLFPVVESVIALFDGRIVFSGTLDELRQSTLDEVKHFVRCRFELSADAAGSAGNSTDSGEAAP